MIKRKRKRWKLVSTLVTALICVGMVLPADISFAAGTPYSFDAQINAARAALEKAEQEQKDAEKKYEQGSMGFIDWMLEKNGLTDTQKYDLEQAKKVINDACEEDFSKWGVYDTPWPEKRKGKVTVQTDLYDAVSLYNLQESFDILKDTNRRRRTDENFAGSLRRNDAKTNFYFMAVAQTAADRAVGVRRHSLLLGECENLHSGSSASGAVYYSLWKKHQHRNSGSNGHWKRQVYRKHHEGIYHQRKERDRSDRGLLQI